MRACFQDETSLAKVLLQLQSKWQLLSQSFHLPGLLQTLFRRLLRTTYVLLPTGALNVQNHQQHIGGGWICFEVRLKSHQVISSVPLKRQHFYSALTYVHLPRVTMTYRVNVRSLVIALWVKWCCLLTIIRPKGGSPCLQEMNINIVDIVILHNKGLIIWNLTRGKQKVGTVSIQTMGSGGTRPFQPIYTQENGLLLLLVSSMWQPEVYCTCTRMFHSVAMPKSHY